MENECPTEYTKKPENESIYIQTASLIQLRSATI